MRVRTNERSIPRHAARLVADEGNAIVYGGDLLDFELTAFDTVTLTSEFTVEPVPEPTTGALLAFGLALLAGRRSRR